MSKKFSEVLAECEGGCSGTSALNDRDNITVNSTFDSQTSEKSVTVTARNGSADEIMDILKLSGLMPGGQTAVAHVAVTAEPMPQIAPVPQPAAIPTMEGFGDWFKNTKKKIQNFTYEFDPKSLFLDLEKALQEINSQSEPQISHRSVQRIAHMTIEKNPSADLDELISIAIANVQGHKKLITRGYDPDGPSYSATFLQPDGKTIGYGLHKGAHGALDDASAMEAAKKIAHEKGYKLLRVDNQSTLKDIFVSGDYNEHFPYGKKKQPMEEGVGDSGNWYVRIKNNGVWKILKDDRNSAIPFTREKASEERRKLQNKGNIVSISKSWMDNIPVKEGHIYDIDTKTCENCLSPRQEGVDPEADEKKLCVSCLQHIKDHPEIFKESFSELPNELYDAESERNSMYCDQCGGYHSGNCDDAERAYNFRNIRNRRHKYDNVDINDGESEFRDFDLDESLEVDDMDEEEELDESPLSPLHINRRFIVDRDRFDDPNETEIDRMKVASKSTISGFEDDFASFDDYPEEYADMSIDESSRVYRKPVSNPGVTDKNAEIAKKVIDEVLGRKPHSSARIGPNGEIRRWSIYLGGGREINLSKIKPKLDKLKEKFVNTAVKAGVNPKSLDVKFHAGPGAYMSVRIKLGMPTGGDDHSINNYLHGMEDEMIGESHWWGGNPHSVEELGHFPEDEEYDEEFPDSEIRDSELIVVAIGPNGENKFLTTTGNLSDDREEAHEFYSNEEANREAGNLKGQLETDFPKGWSVRVMVGNMLENKKNMNNSLADIKRLAGLNESLETLAPDRGKGLNGASKGWQNEPNEQIAGWRAVVDDSQGLSKPQDMFNPVKGSDNIMTVASNKKKPGLHEDEKINKIASDLYEKFLVQDEQQYNCNEVGCLNNYDCDSCKTCNDHCKCKSEKTMEGKDSNPRCSCGHFNDEHTKAGCKYKEHDGWKCSCKKPKKVMEGRKFDIDDTGICMSCDKKLPKNWDMEVCAKCDKKEKEKKKVKESSEKTMEGKLDTSKICTCGHSRGEHGPNGSISSCRAKKGKKTCPCSKFKEKKEVKESAEKEEYATGAEIAKEVATQAVGRAEEGHKSHNKGEPMTDNNEPKPHTTLESKKKVTESLSKSKEKKLRELLGNLEKKVSKLSAPPSVQTRISQSLERFAEKLEAMRLAVDEKAASQEPKKEVKKPKKDEESETESSEDKNDKKLFPPKKGDDKSEKSDEKKDDKKADKKDSKDSESKETKSDDSSPAGKVNGIGKGIYEGIMNIVKKSPKIVVKEFNEFDYNANIMDKIAEIDPAVFTVYGYDAVDDEVNSLLKEGDRNNEEVVNMTKVAQQAIYNLKEYGTPISGE